MTWDVLHSIAGSVCQTETAASHWRTTPVLRGSCKQGPERGDSLVPRATPWGQELQNLLCSHGILLLLLLSFHFILLQLLVDTLHSITISPSNVVYFFISQCFCSLTEHTIWWTQAEMQTDGARRSRKCGERSIRGPKIQAYRSTVPLVATPL